MIDPKDRTAESVLSQINSSLTGKADRALIRIG